MYSNTKECSHSQVWTVTLLLIIYLVVYLCSYCYYQSQAGSTDCGWFALLFISILTKGDNPSHHIFEQKKMKSHLHLCLSEGSFKDFPTRMSRTKKY